MFVKVVHMHIIEQHLEQASHDAANISENAEHEGDPDDSKEKAEETAAEGARSKIAITWVLMIFFMSEPQLRMVSSQVNSRWHELSQRLDIESYLFATLQDWT